MSVCQLGSTVSVCPPVQPSASINPSMPPLIHTYEPSMSGKFLYLHILHKFLSGSISSPLWMQGLAKACLGEHCSKHSGKPCPLLISSAMFLRLGFWLPLWHLKSLAFPRSFREDIYNPCFRESLRGTSATAASAVAKVLQWTTLPIWSWVLSWGAFDRCCMHVNMFW